MFNFDVFSEEWFFDEDRLLAKLSNVDALIVDFTVSELRPDHILHRIERSLGGHMGHKHSDYKAGGLVTIRVPATGPRHRPQHSNISQRPHNDGAYQADPPDVVALCCIEAAEEGGESTIIPTRVLLNELTEAFSAETVGALFAPDAYTVIRGDSEMTRPMLSRRGHIVEISYSDHEFNKAVPRADLRDVFDWLRAFTADDRRAERTLLKAGQCLIFANSRVLHGRSAWRDGKRGTRTFLRSWIRSPRRLGVAQFELDESTWSALIGRSAGDEDGGTDGDLD